MSFTFTIDAPRRKFKNKVEQRVCEAAQEAVTKGNFTDPKGLMQHLEQIREEARQTGKLPNPAHWYCHISNEEADGPSAEIAYWNHIYVGSWNTHGHNVIIRATKQAPDLAPGWPAAFPPAPEGQGIWFGQLYRKSFQTAKRTRDKLIPVLVYARDERDASNTINEKVFGSTLWIEPGSVRELKDPEEIQRLYLESFKALYE